MSKVDAVWKQITAIMAEAGLKPGEIAALADKLNSYINFKRDISGQEPRSRMLTVVSHTDPNAVVILPHEDVVGERIYTNLSYQGRWVLDMIERLNEYYLVETDRFRGGLIEMLVNSNRLSDLIRHVHYVIAHAPKNRLIDEMLIVADMEAGSPDLKQLAGELLKRFDALNITYKQYCGGLGLVDLAPDETEAVKQLHVAIEALIGIGSKSGDNGKALRLVVHRLDPLCARLMDLGQSVNKSKGNWARADKDYKQAIYDEVSAILKEDPTLEGQNTKLGRMAMKQLASRENNLSQPEQSGLYVLRKWDKDGVIAREMYDLIQDCKPIPSHISRYSITG